jgi:hypothetical protein
VDLAGNQSESIMTIVVIFPFAPQRPGYLRLVPNIGANFRRLLPVTAEVRSGVVCRLRPLDRPSSLREPVVPGFIHW